MKKKTLSCVSLLLLFSLVGCGTTANSGESTPNGGSGGGNTPNSNGEASYSSPGDYSDYSEGSYSFDNGGVDNDGKENREMIFNGETVQPETYTPETLAPINFVKAFAPTAFTHAYAWTETNNKVTELLGKWPGTKLSDYNTRWKSYDFPADKTAFNLIFNNGSDSNKTGTLKVDGAGHYWYSGSKLVHSDTEPAQQSSSGGTSDWHPKEGNIYKDSANYSQPSYIPKPKYFVVNSAKDYTELPVVRNWNKTSQVNPYKGKRDDFRDESIYFAITTRFYDGDSSNNTHCWDAKNDDSSDPNWRGDFKGLIQKMDYIKAQGFTAIWITPVVKNASGFDYHGYHAINFKEVDPRYESEDVSFQTVINEAHKRDMKIVLDIVINHTCNFGEENLFPMFYYDAKNNTTIKALTRNRTKEYGILPDSYDTTNNPGGMRFDYLKTDAGDPHSIYHHDPDGSLSWESYSEQTGQIAGDCVDLNTENPTVANYLVEAYANFIHMGVDAFRLDTVKHVSRLTLNKYYVPAFYNIAEKCGNKSFYMFGEVCVKDNDVWNRGQQSDSVPFYTWAETSNYAWGDMKTNAASAKKHWGDYLNPSNHPTSNNAYLNGLDYHTPDHSKSSKLGVIDFPMHWNFDSARNSFGVATSKDNVYNDATYNVVYVDSHDYAPNENQTKRYVGSTSAWKENMSLMFTFRGIPCIYYGSEVEFKKSKTIDNGPNLALEESGRAYFGSHLVGSVKTSGFGEYSGENGKLGETLKSELSLHLQKLNRARLSCIALRRGQYTTSNVSGNAMAFTRRYKVGNTDSIACVAISGGATFRNLPNGTYKDLYGGGTIVVNNGSLTANASGQGNVQIWVKQ